jgi:ribosomal protein L40E
MKPVTLPKGYKKPEVTSSIVKIEPDLFSRPIAGANMLEIQSYEVSILKGAEGYSGLNMVEIRPIELDASLLFYNKKSRQGPIYPLSKVKDIRITHQVKGSLRKKTDLMVEIELDLPKGYGNVILIDLEDKFINPFIQQVNQIRSKLDDESLWTYQIINFQTATGIITPIKIYPMAPFLSSGEQIVWNNIKTKGIVNKKIQWLDLVTDYRVYQYDYDSKLGNFVLISGIDDVIVNNQRRMSNSNRYGTFTHSRYVTGVFGNTKSTSMTIGDIVIIADGKPYVTFKDISDPNGLARIIKSMRKQCNFSLRNNETIETIESKPEVVIQNDENEITSNAILEEMLRCSNCNSENLPNSKFCNKCGSKLETVPICNRCNHVNLEDAIFCNQCGYKL